MIQTDAVHNQLPSLSQNWHNRCSNGNFGFWWRPVSILSLWELLRNCAIHLRYLQLQTCNKQVFISFFLNVVYVLSTGLYPISETSIFQTRLKRLSFSVLNLLTNFLKILRWTLYWYSRRFVIVNFDKRSLTYLHRVVEPLSSALTNWPYTILRSWS